MSDHAIHVSGFPSSASQLMRACADAVASSVSRDLAKGPRLPGYTSTAKPPITNDWLGRVVVFTDTSKPGYLKAGTPNAWTYFDGSAV